ncbi:MAG TPA: alpha/beta hydrolase [Actinocrinis sp.]|jgi:pimeloyl-ACP methyl ester carboxylesterase|uniref:alpha/beta fold hydrolase n=1 Tax=Actinocrinis sp. TaxID=1920516 RepID=UPI002DDCECEC|nr:alpha/beta hydrolase [Actinocrinis sp.]HEV3173511.1 alpha/beta hydrolase [Actinocrinis sp.]
MSESVNPAAESAASNDAAQGAPALKTVTSADGTTIAYQAFGNGAPVILIGGAFNDRTTMLGVAGVLAPRFTGVVYDRRGRGDSTDNAKDGADEVEREIEDLAALIGALGDRASLFGHSSGGILALEAVMRGLPVDKVAVYEVPYIPEGSRPLPPADGFERLKNIVGRGDADGAATLFLTEQVGVPAPVVEQMRAEGEWAYLAAQAHSLPYDAALGGPVNKIPSDRLTTIRTPALVINGDRTWDWMQTAAGIVAQSIPGAQHRVLPGQDHGVLAFPEELRAALTEFLA